MYFQRASMPDDAINRKLREPQLHRVAYLHTRTYVLIVMYVLTFLDLITFIFYIDSYVYFMVLKVSFNSYVLKCRLNTKTTRPTSFELTILSVY